MTNDVDRHVGRFRRKIFRSGGIAAAAVLLVIAGIWIGFAGGRSAPTAGITTCGSQLCFEGEPWPLAVGTVYNGLDEPDNAVAAVEALNLDVVRITDFLDTAGAVATAPYDAKAWRSVDRLIASAGRAGLHVELDFSTYRNLLKQSGVNPYGVDWLPFLRFVASRINTETGTQYADDPTIALISFAGEVDGIHGGDNSYGLTTSQLTGFYRTVENFWHEAAPGQLLTAGGLSQLSWNSGIDWRAIFSLPHNDIDSLHAYTWDDVAITVPAVAEFSRSKGKPWIIEEFGFPAELPDRERADKFAKMFETARNHGAAGIGLWNVGDQRTDTYDVGPQFPLTFQAVRTNAP